MPPLDPHHAFAHGDDEGRLPLSHSIPIEQAETSLSACTAIDERATRSIRHIRPSARVRIAARSAQARARLRHAP